MSEIENVKIRRCHSLSVDIHNFFMLQSILFIYCFLFVAFLLPSLQPVTNYLIWSRHTKKKKKIENINFNWTVHLPVIYVYDMNNDEPLEKEKNRPCLDERRVADLIIVVLWSNGCGAFSLKIRGSRISIFFLVLVRTFDVS